MPNARRVTHISPRVLIAAPIVVLTILFAVFSLLISMRADFPAIAVISLFAGAGAIYAAAIGLLYRMGMTAVTRLETLSHTDTLCGLPNRRALHAQAQRTITQGEEISFALIDLDGFKLVNDLYGHAAGDRLIQQVASLLRESAGKEAHAYRLGGDEFAVIMSGALSGTILEGICRSFLSSLSEPFLLGQRRIALSASIGLTTSDGQDGLGSSELLRRADVAMYVSKRGGKARCTWYKNEFDRDLETIRSLDNEMRDGLDEGKFHLLYQPLVDARSQHVVAVEALLRWDRGDAEAVPPSIFIPAAEESGLINGIGLFVLKQACEDALGWGDITLSVNISAVQLRNPDFPVRLGQILEETGFPAHRLELEITETCLVLDPVLAERSLDVIRSFGMRVALDDFGTGFASIGFLRRFRFEKLKLDRSLVVDSAEDEGSRAVMLSTISMAHALKMGVAAEGVETEAQAELVRRAGCDQIQGWLYFRAMPPEEVSHLLQSTQHTTPARRVISAGAP